MAPSLIFLCAVLSLDVTRVLVERGHGLGYDTAAAAAASSGVGRFTRTLNPTTGLAFPPLNIVACTGAGVPIIITTQYPHGVSDRGIGGMSCIISGVSGNTAANNIATNPQDSTVGLEQGVLAVATGPTTLALYGQDQDVASATVGQLIPLVGNGAWTSGGTVVPALTDGSILLGRENVRENSAPPRIVMIPTTTTWGPRSGAIPNGDRTGERARTRAQRSLKTNRYMFEVHCWNQRNPLPNSAYDFDATIELAHALENSAHLLFGLTQEPVAGSWDDSKEMAAQYIKAGRLFTFALGIDVPVLDYRYPVVPDGSVFEVTAQGITAENQTPEIAQVFDVPLG